MAWRDNLRAASFRGVEFFVESSEAEFGRRGVTHEFVQRDKPFGEDTGRLARKFPVDAYVIGDDYLEQKNKLIAALEVEGPGELIHPYYGRQVVDCFGGVRVRESVREGRMAIFSMPFVEHGEELYPSATADPSSLLGDASGALKDAALKDFAKKFSVLNLPAFVLGDATKRVDGLANTMSKISGGISGRSNVVADFALAVRKLQSNAIRLVNTPSTLGAEIQGTLALLAQSATAPKAIFGAMKKMFGYGQDEPPIPTPTATRVAQAQNAEALNTLTRTTVVAEAAVAATEISYNSTDEALQYRDAILEETEELMETAPDDTYQALQDLRARLVKAVPPPGEDLATVGRIKNQVTVPSLALTYDLYESLDLEEDLILRNKVAHPAFVPGGKTLEVLELEQT